MVVQKSFGQILLPNDPGAPLQAGTKQYIDAGDAANVPTTRQVIAGTGLSGGGTLAADRTFTVAYGSSSTTACVGNDSRLSGNAPTASPTFTGTATFAKMVQTPVTLTYVSAGTTLVDASLGNTFRLTLTGATTKLGNPSNSTDGQMILVEVIQDGTGSRLLTYDTNFAFGTLVTSPVLTTTLSKTDFIGFMYNSTAGKWRCIAFAPGY